MEALAGVADRHRQPRRDGRLRNRRRLCPQLRFRERARRDRRIGGRDIRHSAAVGRLHRPAQSRYRPADPRRGFRLSGVDVDVSRLCHVHPDLCRLRGRHHGPGGFGGDADPAAVELCRGQRGDHPAGHLWNELHLEVPGLDPAAVDGAAVPGTDIGGDDTWDFPSDDSSRRPSLLGRSVLRHRDAGHRGGAAVRGRPDRRTGRLPAFHAGPRCDEPSVVVDGRRARGAGDGHRDDVRLRRRPHADCVCAPADRGRYSPTCP